MRIGWLGLGAMGAPMARRLLDTASEVVVFDPLTERGRVPAEAGARGAASEADTAASARTLFVMVATPEHAETALFGETGAAHALAPGSTVVVMSTIGPVAVRDLAGRLAEREIALLDAPVTGGAARAASGELVIMVGGPAATLAAVRSLLDRLGSAVVHVGEAVGDGQSVKMVNQLLCGVHLAAAAEALGLAAALGLDPRVVWDVVRRGAAASFMLEERGYRMLEGDFEPTRGALDIFVKDLGLLGAAARARRYPTPLAATAESLYLMGRAAGLGPIDDSSIIKLYEAWAGRPVSRATEETK